MIKSKYKMIEEMKQVIINCSKTVTYKVNNTILFAY